MSNRPWSDPELSSQAPGLLKRAWFAATEAERDEIRAIVRAEDAAGPAPGANDMHELITPSTSLEEDAQRAASLILWLARSRLSTSVADRAACEISSLTMKVKNRATE
jgi:hypothetical protein